MVGSRARGPVIGTRMAWIRADSGQTGSTGTTGSAGRKRKLVRMMLVMVAMRLEVMVAVACNRNKI